MQSPGSYADVNGLRMYYEIHGSGPPLLLLHELTGSSERFRVDLPLWAQDFQVIVAEWMGHGRTADRVDRDFHYHDLAEDMVALMRHLKVDAASFVGKSAGGIIGLDMAIHHPDRLVKLAVTGSTFRVDGYDPKALEWVLTTKPEDWPRYWREAYERLSPDGPSHWPVFFERWRRMAAVEPNYTRDQMAGIKVPTLVIVGDRDLVTPEHAVEMFRIIPGAKLCVVPGAGHRVLPTETVLAFLKEPGEPAATHS